MKFKCAVIFCLSITACAAQLKNSDFELRPPTAADSIPEWLAGQSGYRIRIDTGIARSGKNSLLIDGTGQHGNGSVFQAAPLPVNGPRRFRLSAFFKTEYITSGSVGLFASTDNTIGPVYYDWTEVQAVAGDPVWKKISLDFITDETVPYAVVGGTINGSGKVWFDDFKLEEMAQAPLSQSALDYLAHAREIILKHSMQSKEIDTAKLSSKMVAAASGAATPQDVYPAIRYALTALHDGHSHFMPPAETKKWEATKNDPIPFVKGKIVDKGIGYLDIGSFSSGNENRISQYADSAQALIRSLTMREKINCWIVDLRRNQGGNAYAMLAAIGPLLGNGTCGYFIRPNGTSSSWFYRNGKSGYDNIIMAHTAHSNFPPISNNARVAVLINDQTESAGEVLAVCFSGRRHARSFGSATFGNTTNNEEFRLSDGAVIFLATSRYADRNKKMTDGKIKPDITVTPPIGTEADPVVQAAIEWSKKGTP